MIEGKVEKEGEEGTGRRGRREQRADLAGENERAAGTGGEGWTRGSASWCYNKEGGTWRADERL